MGDCYHEVYNPMILDYDLNNRFVEHRVLVLRPVVHTKSSYYGFPI